jgi:hypothetical protein
MTDTINSAIEGWDIGSPKQETPHQDDVLAMSAPAVLKLPETVGSSSSSDPSVSNTSPTRHLPSKVNEISKPIMVTLDGITNPTNNPANKEQHIQPTRPPKEMNKIMYVSSPRSAKIMDLVGLNDIEYMRYRKKYNIILPSQEKEKEENEMHNHMKKEELNNKRSGKKGVMNGSTKTKEKKKSKQQMQNELQELWVSSKIDLLKTYDMCCNKLSIQMDPLIQALISREPSKNEILKPMTSLRIDPNDPMPPPTEEELAAMQKKKKKDSDNINNELPKKDDKRLPLGPGGCRAFMSALAGGWVGGTTFSPKSGLQMEQIKHRSIPTINGQFVIEKKVEQKDSKKIKKVKIINDGYKFLEKLIIRNGNIKTIGSKSISDFLERNSSLKSLVLYNNTIESNGAFSIGKSLRYGYNRTLTKLAIDVDQSIGDVGIIHLTRGLETNSTLTDLSLCCCGFKVEGTRALSSLLMSATSNIQLLSIRGNAIGGEGLNELSKALSNIKKNIGDDKSNNNNTNIHQSICKLQFLNIANIGINGSHVLELQRFGQSLMICKSLKAINFDYNCIGEDGGQSMINGWNNDDSNISHINQFVISCSLPANIFNQIYKKNGNGKKRKKKKKKRKKKKGDNNNSVDISIPEIIPDLQQAIQWMAKAIEERKKLQEEEDAKRR